MAYDGPFPITLADGGTNASLTASNGGIFYSTASAGAILAGTATAHQILLSGASTTPLWSTSTYPTTNAVNTLLYASSANTMAALATANNGVLITSASGVPSWLAAGTTGQVLTATTGSPATWASAAGSSITLTGDTGGGLTGSSFTFTGVTQILSGGFAGSGTTLNLNFSDGSANLFLGASAGKTGYSGSNNTGVGASALEAISSGILNSAYGAGSLGHITTGGNNCAFGVSALNGSLATGSYNCAIGVSAGANYTAAESSNILIGYNVGGTASESNVLRIGVGNGTGTGQLAKAFIQGISGVTVTGSTVLCSTVGQLGTIASSIRYKENIQKMNPSDSLLKLRPVSFNYKVEEEKLKHYGLIAEEVEQYFPELIVYDSDGKPETIKYHEMYSMLIYDLQLAVKRIEDLEKRLNDNPQ